jgi:hydrophobic/amphiphilic exporter-1 (mainly G- bacteria), HAE1 family
MTFLERCIRRPIAVLLLSISLLVAGGIAYLQLPVAALPSYDAPVINVRADLSGANAETMASAVALPLEKQFSTIAGLNLITSSSVMGETSITLEFAPGVDINAAAVDVQASLLAAQRLLPREMVNMPSYRKVNPAEAPVLSMEITSPSMSLSDLNDYAENLLAPRLSTLPGVAQLNVLGQKRYAVRIRVDLDLLKSRDLSLDELATAIRAANANTPLGVLDGPRQTLVVQSDTQRLNAADYAELVVAERPGGTVRLKDVASVEDSVQSLKSVSSFNGQRSIVLTLQRQPGANIVELVDAVRARMPELQALLPASVEIHMVTDRAASAKAALHDVNFTLALTIALVVMVVFVFIHRIAATLVPVMTIPLSLLGALPVFYWLGYTLDSISLLGITLAVGLVVDDAIVVLENIARHIAMGKPPADAALDGASEMRFTVLSISLSLVAVFIPIFLMPGVVGLMFHEFAVVVSLAVLASAAVSLTVVPALMSRLPHDAARAGTRRGTGYARRFETAFDQLKRAYGRTLACVLAHKAAGMVAAIAILVLTVVLYVAAPKGFFPDEDLGQVRVTTEAAEDVSPEQMLVLQQRVAASIKADPNVQDVTSALTGDNVGSLFLLLKPRDQRAPMPEVLESLRKAVQTVPGMAVYFRPNQNLQLGGRPSKSRYQFTLQSVGTGQPDFWASRYMERLRAHPVFRDVSSDARSRALQATLRVDRDRAAALGVRMDELRSALYSAFGERQVATIQAPAAAYAVIIEAAAADRRFEDALGKVTVRSKRGDLVRVDSFATIERTLGPLSVNHQGQMQAVTITFNLAPGVALGTATDAIAAIGREIKLPPSIVTAYSGDAAAFQESQTNQLILIAAAIATVYVLLGVLYESLIHPITILIGLPSAALGALLTLRLFGLDLTLIAGIGLLMLIGIVKKNAIMIVDVALVLQRTQHLPAAEAVHAACLMRFRPIMMTTIAALMGALPIALGFGAGAELRRPLGLAVVGGLLLSQLVTLYATPVTYVVLDRLRSRSRSHGTAPVKVNARSSNPTA